MTSSEVERFGEGQARPTTYKGTVTYLSVIREERTNVTFDSWEMNIEVSHFFIGDMEESALPRSDNFSPAHFEKTHLQNISLFCFLFYSTRAYGAVGSALD